MSPVPDSGVWEVPRTESQTDTTPDGYLAVLLPPTEGDPPVTRSVGNLGLDLQRPARVKDWVQGREYRTGELAAYDHRVWRAVTVIASSQTVPPFSTHWHVVGGYAGVWRADHSYMVGEYVQYQSDFYIAVARILADSGSPPTNSGWAHLAPDLEGFRGTWAAGQSYQVGQVVFHTDRFYICREAVSGSNTGPITDTAHWRVLGSFHGAWSDVRYGAGDIVSHDGHLYITPVITTTGEAAPGAAGSTWRRLDITIPTLSGSRSGSNYQVRLGPSGAHGAATVPAAVRGSTPEATRGGLITAVMVNDLHAAVTAVEGRLRNAMIWRGAWASGASYEPGDVVYDSTGQVSHYICLAAVTSTTNPGADTAHWRRLH